MQWGGLSGSPFGGWGQRVPQGSGMLSNKVEGGRRARPGPVGPQAGLGVTVSSCGNGSAGGSWEEAKVQAWMLLPVLRTEIPSWALSLGIQDSQGAEGGHPGKGGNLPQVVGVPEACTGKPSGSP